MNILVAILLLTATTMQQTFGRSPSYNLTRATQHRIDAEAAHKKADVEFQNAVAHRDRVAKEAEDQGNPPPYGLDDAVNKARANYILTKGALEQAKKAVQECEDAAFAFARAEQTQEDGNSAWELQRQEFKQAQTTNAKDSLRHKVETAKALLTEIARQDPHAAAELARYCKKQLPNDCWWCS